jgi:hypothetical protein
MALEDQAVQEPLNQRQLEMTVKELLEGSGRELW